MTAARIGIIIGAVLALTWITLGFWAFVLVAIAMILGAFIGRLVDKPIDLRNLFNVFRGKRSSS
ncbi:DUF2273 domain-containing protein [Leifsonia shinshuensis]|uniref:DUF2273 domain-containing protein n=1 Tax=Leifsonia shinshuensis TaxID=150026 RepID=UPI001F506EFE|nr:DUF2273 domain-containing protein [Leifsonia shinshuensis]MCI0158731.1 DUF2273 domain-containing protein [Leifsonia shinshuensis]